MKREEVLEKIDGALGDLETALASGKSEQLNCYLAFLARFHRYSFCNVMLIAAQCPDATLVAGFNAWKKMGRHVRKGEKGIRILAPLLRKKKADEDERSSTEDKPDDEGETKRILTGFRAVSVFDVSQTDGEELPEIREYEGDPASNLERLEEFAASREIEVIWEEPGGGALGVSLGGTVKITPDLAPAEKFSALTHEVAHELLHRGDRRSETTRVIRETEAEAVAFAVSSAIGLDVGTGASDYIHLHQGDAEKLRASLEHIRLTASEMLSALEPERALACT